MRAPVLFLARAGLRKYCTELIGCSREKSGSGKNLRRRLVGGPDPPCFAEYGSTTCQPLRGSPPPVRVYSPTRTTCKPQESLREARGRGSTSCRGRTCAGRRVGGRTACNGCAGAKRTWASCFPWRCCLFWPSFPLLANNLVLFNFSPARRPLTAASRDCCLKLYAAPGVRNGIPIARSSARACSSVFAVVTIVIFMPFWCSTLE